MPRTFELTDAEGDQLSVEGYDNAAYGHVLLNVAAHVVRGGWASVYLHSHEMRDLAKWLIEAADEIEKKGGGDE